MTDHNEPPIPLNERVAANIRAAMAIQKVSAARLAGRLDEGPRWVQRRTSGTADLTLQDVERFALVLDVPVSHLLTLAN